MSMGRMRVTHWLISMGEKSCEIKIWLMKRIWKEEDYINKDTFGIHGLRCFSSMLSSMPKGEIVSMNVDAMGKYCRTLILIVFVIDDNIVIINRAACCDHWNKDDRLIIHWCPDTETYYDMS